MKRIILFGAPGSGKGTQAEKIENEFGYMKISTGDLIRDEVSKKSDIGNKIEDTIKSGNLISDEIIIDIVKKKINGKDITSGYIMDGFPRTLFQAEALSKVEVEKEIPIFLKVNDDMVVKRITSRLFCKTCGKIYNKKFNPPKKRCVCDNCGEVLSERTDDSEEIIKKRIHVYRKETMPVIEFYKQKGNLREIDAVGEINDIYSVVRDIIK
ncbi:MAG: adenylate kinase [Acidobacteriota bacterium]